MSESSFKKPNDRALWIDFLRIIAMIAVIFIHTTAKYNLPADTTRVRVFYSFKPLFQFAVPVFVMISGTFMLDPERSFSTKKLFTKNALRIVIALIFWTVVYAVAYYFVGDAKGQITSVIGNLICGPNHLWYLSLLLGLYVITPLLRRITNSERYTKYFLILSFAITFVAPLLLQLCGLIDGLLAGRFNTSLKDMIKSNLFDFRIVYSESLTFYYVFGYWLRKKELTKKQSAALMLFGLLGIVYQYVIEYFHCAKTGIYSSDLVGMQFACMLTVIGIFTFGKTVIGSRMNGKKTGKVVSFFAGLSFGVYLLQSLIIVVVQYLIFDFTKYNPLLSAPAAAGIVLVICLAITFVLKKIPVLNKYIV